METKDNTIALEVTLLEIRLCAKKLALNLVFPSKKYWVGLYATKTTEDIVIKMAKMEAGLLWFVKKLLKLVFPSFLSKNK